MMQFGERIDPAGIRRWLLNVASSYADVIVGGVIYVVLTPIIVGRLGADAYAVWILSHTITFYLGFLDLGVGEAQVRYHARFEAEDDQPAIRSLVGTTTAFLALAGAVAALLAGIFALSPASTWIGVSDALAGEFKLVLLILGANLLLSFPSSALTDIYAGAQRFDLENVRSITLRVAAAAAQLVCLFLGYGLIALALIELAATVLGLILDLIMTSRLVPGLLSRGTRFSAAMWREIRSFAHWSVLDELLVEGTTYLDRFLIVALLPMALLSPYAIISTLAGVLLVVVHPIAETFFPMASGMHAGGRTAALGQLVFAGTKMITALAAPVAVFLSFFGDAVLAVWVPEVATESTAALVTIISLNLFVSVFLWTPGTVLLAMGRFRRLAALTTVEILISIVIILVLAPRFGLLGIAAAQLISNVLVGFGLLLPTLSSELGSSRVTLVGAGLGRVLVACVPAVAVALTLRLWLTEPNLIALGLAAAGIAAVYVPSLLMLGLGRDERGRYLAVLRGYLGPSGGRAVPGEGRLARALGWGGE